MTFAFHLLAALVVFGTVCLSLAALAALCDRWASEDPAYDRTDRFDRELGALRRAARNPR